MGKKYIIELEEPEMFDERKYYQCSQMPWWAVSENIVENLTPYAEPDLEQVRKEGYEDGYKTAKVQCNIQAEKDMREVGERHYQRGLSDAWEAARKVTQVRKYGGYGDCLEEVFGRHRVPWDVFDYSASEAIEKIRQYEQEKEEQIQAGDEVIRHYKNEFMEGDDAPSIFLSEEDGCFRCLAFNGRSIMIAEYPKNQYRKTGRHFPEIAEVLQKMKES